MRESELNVQMNEFGSEGEEGGKDWFTVGLGDVSIGRKAAAEVFVVEDFSVDT